MDFTIWKQAFVATGASLNMAQLGIVAGYMAGTLPQLKQPNSEIPVDDDAGSWLASAPGISFILGSLSVASIMGNYGRWTAGVVSSAISVVGWLCIVFANNYAWLMIGRFLQGINLGQGISSSTVIVGECSSPKHRGLFLTALTAGMSFGALLAQPLSFYLHWRTCALVCAISSYLCLLICIYSPESPSWLAAKGRYGDCKKSFRWIRGRNEEEELDELIEVTKEVKELNGSQYERTITIKRRVELFLIVIKRKEVYKSLIIACHLSLVSHWSGLMPLSIYPREIIYDVVGNDANVPLIVTLLTTVRFVSNTCMLFVIKKVKRKRLLLVGGGLNILMLFAVAVYSFVKWLNILPFEDPLAGIFLILALMFSIAVGTLPIAVGLPGEIFPLAYRSFISSFGSAATAINYFFAAKLFHFMNNNIGIYGTFSICGIICVYSITVVYIILPETKDKTLQEIEEEYKGRPRKSTEKSGQSFLNDVD